jgi:hypothetical protein
MIDGLRMALAGFPPNQPVVLGENCGVSASTVSELRAIEHMPYPLEVLIPYRLMPDSIVSVNRLAPEWEHTER